MDYKVDSEFEKQLAELGGDGAALCFQCGTCTAGCPSGRRTSYRVRRLVRMAQLDMKDEIINSEELWMCSTCYTCVERCPRRVPIVDIVIALRNITVAEGHIRPAYKKTASNLYACGHAVAINDGVKAIRKSLGLPEVPPTVLGNDVAASQFKKLLDAAGFNKIVE